MRRGSVEFHFASGSVLIIAGHSAAPPDAGGMNADKLRAINS
jgi:hypothetical protein